MLVKLNYTIAFDFWWSHLYLMFNLFILCPVKYMTLTLLVFRGISNHWSTRNPVLRKIAFSHLYNTGCP